MGSNLYGTVDIDRKIPTANTCIFFFFLICKCFDTDCDTNMGYDIPNDDEG